MDSDEFQLPPPIPATEPPPLPGPSKLAKSPVDEHPLVESADLIKKELKDNIKSVENWKIEQEILMKVIKKDNKN